MTEQGVVAHVGLGIIRVALDAGVMSEEGLLALDTCEVAVDTCLQKKAAGQNMKNPAGLLVKLIKDPQRLIGEEVLHSARKAFRQKEQTLLAQQELAEQRALVMEYEQYRDDTARAIFEELPEAARTNLRKEKADIFKQQARYEKLEARIREQEIDDLICHDLARREVPPFEKWYIRRRAQQAVLPFGTSTTQAVAS